MIGGCTLWVKNSTIVGNEQRRCGRPRNVNGLYLLVLAPIFFASLVNMSHHTKGECGRSCCGGTK